MKRLLRGRVRLLLASGVVFGLLLTGTHALWTDSASSTTGTFSAGTVSVLLGPHEVSDFTMKLQHDTLRPGESTTGTVRVYNRGSLPYTFSVVPHTTGSWVVDGYTPLHVTSTSDTWTLQPGKSAKVDVTVRFDATTSDGFTTAAGDVVLTVTGRASSGGDTGSGFAGTATATVHLTGAA